MYYLFVFLLFFFLSLSFSLVRLSFLSDGSAFVKIYQRLKCSMIICTYIIYAQAVNQCSFFQLRYYNVHREFGKMQLKKKETKNAHYIPLVMPYSSYFISLYFMHSMYWNIAFKWKELLLLLLLLFIPYEELKAVAYHNIAKQ